VSEANRMTGWLRHPVAGVFDPGVTAYLLLLLEL